MTKEYRLKYEYNLIGLTADKLLDEMHLLYMSSDDDEDFYEKIEACRHELKQRIYA